MGFAFTHLIVAWGVGKIYENISKKKIPRIAWFLLLFGGILPDGDLLLDWIFSVQVHRTFTHSLLFMFLAGIVLYLISFYYKDKNKRLLWSYALSFGILMHILVDLWSTKGIQLLWPSPLFISYTSIHFLAPNAMDFLSYDLLKTKKMLKNAIFDMGLGTIWIFWLWWKQKIHF